MHYAQINPNDKVDLLNPDTAYSGAWDKAKLVLEDQGYLFIELDSPELPGTHYDRSTEQFYTPAPPQPEPLPMEKDLLAIMDGVAATYERQEKGNLDIMEGIAGLYEATMTGGNPK
ncbi:hypothetical protein ACLGL1_01190 [Peptococcus simiae]|uniref:hypothetical protein n=1 Tax=Peptococcus simiae TaxID=1643805 RepID=UPI003980BB00